MDYKQITPDFTAATQMREADMKAAAEAGFTTIINNRPDGEVFGQPQSEALKVAALDAGLDYIHVPVGAAGVSDADVQAVEQALMSSDGPVLAFCRSGTRSTYLWALAIAPHMDPDAVISAAAQGGYDVSGLKPHLDMRHAQGRES